MINTSSQAFLADHILEQSLDLICTIDQDGRFVYVNNACERLLSYQPQYLIGKPAVDFVHPDDHEKTDKVRYEAMGGDSLIRFENRLISSSGKEVTFSWSFDWSPEEGVLICIGRDITHQAQTIAQVLEKEAFYQALIEHGSDMLALLDEKGIYKYVGGSTKRILGYSPNELIGMSAFGFIHPEDIPKALEGLEQILTKGGHVPVSAFRFKDAAGDWKWIETIASNQLDNPGIRSIVLSSRDVTDTIYNKLWLSESEQRFKALFENNPDMVHFESKEGIILDANPAVLSYYGIEKTAIIGRSMASFLSADAALICDLKREEAISGHKVKFELDMEIAGFEHLGHIIMEISKVPVEINGNIVGVYIISRDITAIRNSQNTIRQQAKKLNNIFESITDAFFTIDTSWNFTYINSECERLLGIHKDHNIGKRILDVFPEEIDGKFHKEYQYAVATGTSVNFEAFFERTNRWLEVRAFPYNEGLSVYFADVSERVRIEQELEKLSIVASKTNNGVIILDALGYTEWVNEGFTRITGYAASDIVGRKPSEILHGPDTDKAVVSRMSAQMLEGQSFTDEILNYKKSGEEVWISINITPVHDEAGRLLRQVAILTDITDKVKYRQKLKELSLVASTSTNGIFITDAERRIEWINDGFTRLTGFAMDEVVGKRPSELLHNAKTPSESFNLAKERMIRGEAVAFEVLYSAKNGDEIWVSAEVNPVQDEHGKLSRFISTMTDITALKKSELELTQLTKDLYRHNRDMQQFTYIVSHNLRSPVANAIGLTTLLGKLDKNSDAFGTGLLNLKKCVSQLDLIIQDMNTILSIKDVKETFDKEEVELKLILQQVEASLQEPLEKCKGKLILDLPTNYTVSGNKAYLHSIFYNLLSNAIKYKSPDRDLLVTVSYYVSKSGDPAITFSDNGSGFNMEKVGHRLFKLYNRFHSGVAEGRGIGLFLVKTHLEALGGKIEANSEVNKGTTFTIYIK